MNENIYWVIELAVTPGRFEDLKTLAAELLEANRNKVGFLTYGVAINDDRQVCHIYERFEDSAAIMNQNSMSSTLPVRCCSPGGHARKPTRVAAVGMDGKTVLKETHPSWTVSLTLTLTCDGLWGGSGNLTLCELPHLLSVFKKFWSQSASEIVSNLLIGATDKRHLFQTFQVVSVRIRLHRTNPDGFFEVSPKLERRLSPEIWIASLGSEL